MLVTDHVKDFFNKLINERVLVMVALDVDALCACKILQFLFKCDNVEYSLVPVSSKSDLIRGFHEHKDQYKRMLLLNCGGNMDLLDVLDPPEDITIYIIDCHRPIDLVNFYCESQIYIILKNDKNELEALPDYNDIYQDFSDSEDEDSDDPERASKRHRLDEDALMKRREKRQWQERRKEIIFEYEEFSFYSSSTAVIMYEIAWKMSKDNNELLWWAISGVTGLFQNKRIGRDKYVTSVIDLQAHMSRLNHADEDETNVKSVNCMRVTFEHDLDLALYRHWTLFDSLRHSLVTASSFRVWTNMGMKKLHQFLAEMGIPLTQCKQSYAFMDTKVRDNLLSLVEEAADKFSIRNLKMQSFSAQYGFNHKMCASDTVYVTGALLENISDTKHTSAGTDPSNFIDALESLSRITAPKIEDGLKLAKTQLQAIKNCVSTFIDVGEVLSYGPFLFVNVNEGIPDYQYFGKPIFLNLFCHHLLHAYIKSLGKSKREKAMGLPLVICAPYDVEEGVSIVLGIPPISDDSRKNLFGNAFLHAAERTKSRTAHEHFDSAIVTVKNDDKSKFFDGLISIMS